MFDEFSYRVVKKKHFLPLFVGLWNVALLFFSQLIFCLGKQNTCETMAKKHFCVWVFIIFARKWQRKKIKKIDQVLKKRPVQVCENVIKWVNTLFSECLYVFCFFSFLKTLLLYVLTGKCEFGLWGRWHTRGRLHCTDLSKSALCICVICLCISVICLCISVICLCICVTLLCICVTFLSIGVHWFCF